MVLFNLDFGMQSYSALDLPKDPKFWAAVEYVLIYHALRWGENQKSTHPPITISSSA